MINFNVIRKREEGAIVPEGISVTETEDCTYIRIKVGDDVVFVRYSKKDNEIISYGEEVNGVIDSSKWLGIWGTNG